MLMKKWNSIHMTLMQLWVIVGAIIIFFLMQNTGQYSGLAAPITVLWLVLSEAFYFGEKMFAEAKRDNRAIKMFFSIVLVAPLTYLGISLIGNIISLNNYHNLPQTLFVLPPAIIAIINYKIVKNNP